MQELVEENEALRRQLAELQPAAPEVLTRTPFGYALPKLMNVLNAKLVVVSTPEYGHGPGEGEFCLPVMSGLERLAGYIFPQLIGCYDFKGSAAAEDCLAQVPDCDLKKYLGAAHNDWSDPVTIQATQWFRYWRGRVCSALQVMVLLAEPLADRVEVFPSGGHSSTSTRTVAKGARVVFAVSISGGSITQTEKAALSDLINGTVADISTRALNIGDVRIEWLHFETLEEFLKALQGYGGVDFAGTLPANKNFNLPGRWVDGDYDPEHDLLTNVPGTTLEERRAFLRTPQPADQDMLDTQLGNAIDARSTARVQELLGLDSSNSPLPAGKRPALCADPNASHPASNTSKFSFAAGILNLEAMHALLAAGADPFSVNDYGTSALSNAVYNAEKAPVPEDERERRKVRERAQAVIELCAKEELGMSYAEHVATLAVGCAVTWEYTARVNELGGKTGTLVDICESTVDRDGVRITGLREGFHITSRWGWSHPGDRRWVVECDSSGSQASLMPSQLWLASVNT